MSAHQTLSATGDIVLQLLRLTAASADVFPPLKSASGGALHIAEIVLVRQLLDIYVGSSHLLFHIEISCKQGEVGRVWNLRQGCDRKCHRVTDTNRRLTARPKR
jgi:hypothetical protein